MAKRSVIIRRLKAEKEAALQEAAAARKAVDPLSRTVEERTQNLEVARINLAAADEEFRKLQASSDAKIFELQEQHRLDRIELGEALGEAKQLRYKIEEEQNLRKIVSESFSQAEAKLKELTKENQELKKLDTDSKRLRRRLNNAHGYIGKLAAALRQNNIAIPAETLGNWASTTHTVDEKEDLDVLMQAATPAPVTEMHKPSDFYSQVQPEGTK